MGTDMSEDAKASKTVTDIWHEVQHEQKRFSQIIRILVGLVILAGGVAVAFTLVSYSDVRSFQARFEQEIREARANTRVVVAEWKYENLTQAERLDAIEEEQTAQRQQAELMQAMGSALAASGVKQQPLTLAALSERAVTDARNYGLGAGLATDDLVSGILNARGASLTADDRLLLAAVLADYRSPDKSVPQIQALIEKAQADRMKGFGYALLARHYYALTNEVDRGTDPNCNEVVKDVSLAHDRGVEGIGPYLWAGECWRKRGEGGKAFDSFTHALALKDDPASTSENVRVVANGLGTTLIAQYAAGQMTGDAGTSVIASLRPSLHNLDMADPQGASVKAPLDAARMLLTYAAKIRAEHGGGDVGRAYSTENIGFTYVLDKNWKGCIEHAKQIDTVVASPWNLVVLNICATEQAKTAAGKEKAQLIEAADIARVTLSQFSYDWFAEAELRKLLPSDFGLTVDTLIKASKSRQGAGEQPRLTKTADAGDATQ
jgi:hypothetical protein